MIDLEHVTSIIAHVYDKAVKRVLSFLVVYFVMLGAT